MQTEQEANAELSSLQEDLAEATEQNMSLRDEWAGVIQQLEENSWSQREASIIKEWKESWWYIS